MAKRESEKRVFSKALEKSNGRAIVLVHPYYSRMPGQEKYLETLRSVVSNARLPIIVLEAEDRTHLTKSALSSLTRQPLLFISTQPESSTPLLKLRTRWRLLKAKGLKHAAVSRADPWEAALFDLKSTGLKHAIMGGQLLNELEVNRVLTTSKELDDQQTFTARSFLEKLRTGQGRLPATGCVSTALKNFVKHGLKVSLMPNACWPIKFTTLNRGVKNEKRTAI
ncbi:TPA: hypothetical protein HA318_02125 [Candidatus Micrarchaeota archaeon]|nr:MAG: hypothetical protein AUJ65_06620 [Candidatus Micrarchaeota archaeon CG1_02_51_15]HII38775.1 hypothetical protein [Candidatus Micrarchaeota archaeon]